MKSNDIVKKSFFEINNKIESIFIELLGNDILALDMSKIEAIQYIDRPNVTTYFYNGKPILELHPLKFESTTNKDGVEVSISQPYKVFE